MHKHLWKPFAGALTRTRSSGAVPACASVRAHRAECASRKKSPTLTGAVFVLTAQALELLQENTHWYGVTVSGGLLGGINTYAYVNGSPLMFTDPLGLKTTVTIWQPVGMGSSSFGHVSVDVNGTTYSFGPGGMTVIPTKDYLDKNAFRDGTGVSLGITPQQEAALQACLAKDHGSYSATSNNCGSPVQSCLKDLGIDTNGQTLPASLGNKLLDLGITNGVTSYPASKPAKGWSAPWAR